MDTASERSMSWGYSAEAEQGLIGAMLIDNTVYDRIVDMVSPSDFFATVHRVLFEAASLLIESGRVADLVTVYERAQAKNAKVMEANGGMAYLATLIQNTPSAMAAMRYAEVVRERSLLRRLYAIGSGIAESAVQFRGSDVARLVDEAQTQMMALGASDKRTEFQGMQSLMAEVMEFVDAQFHRHEAGEISDVTGVPSGFTDLDKTTAGLHGGQLIILAARPAMGKSAFSLNIAENAAKATQRHALIFSLEMGNRELGLRLLAASARVNVQRLVIGRLYDDDWSRIGKVMGGLSDTPMAFSETVGITVNEMRARARRAKREFGGLSVIVVDYLQLMLAGETDSNRANQIAEISRGLKLMSKELDVPVIALSQLNRELEKRVNKRPVMSDLRDSGALEQDADVILFIYRDEVYREDTADKGVAEVIIAKQRNGPVGTVRLAFRADMTRFSDLPHDYGYTRVAA